MNINQWNKTEISVREQCYGLECPLKLFFKIQLELELNFDFTAMGHFEAQIYTQISLNFKGFLLTSMIFFIIRFILGYYTQVHFDEEIATFNAKTLKKCLLTLNSGTAKVCAFQSLFAAHLKSVRLVSVRHLSTSLRRFLRLKQ